MKKRYLRIGDIKRNTMIVATAAALGFSSCSSDNQNNNETEWQADQGPSEGILTELTEVEPGTWKITDEKVVAPSATAAILKYNSGTVDTLRGKELEQKVEQYVQANPTNHHGNGMMNVLMWSGLGYMAGRMMSPNPAYYANRNVMQKTDDWRQRNGAEFQNRSKAGNTIYGNRTTRSTAPTSGRSGYFKSRNSGFPS